MRRLALWVLSLTLLVGSVASTPTTPEPQTPWPKWLERWLFNPEERTERAVRSTRQGDPEAAVEPLETALRLAGDDPEVLYNAGAARLGAGQPEAESLLEAAADDGDREIASLARYNLGNARLATDDFSGAIDAYEQALRQDPAFEDAKHNLELARRRLEEQQQQEQEQQQQDQPQDQQQPSGEEPQDQDSPRPGQPPPPSDDSESQESGSEPDSSDPPDPPGSPPPDGRSEGEPEPPPPSESPLPQFRDLADMSAEEAAAILEAIENMEREQRRRDAREAAAQPRPSEKDW